MERGVFEEVGDALESLLPDGLGPLRWRAHRYGIKVWLGDGTPPRTHYEAQIVGGRHLPASLTIGLEVGFHAEERDPAANEAIVAALLRSEKQWRRILGDEATAGPFLGRDGWTRISEVWPDPDLGDPELPLEVAARLTDYLAAIEPLR